MDEFFIVWGRKYPFRKKVSTEQAICEYCLQDAALSSFEAREWWHLYWIPLIPLKQKFVFRECPKCHEALVRDLSDWKALKLKNRRWFKNHYEKEPGNPSYALQAIKALDRFWESSEAWPILRDIEARFPEDRDIQTELSFHYFRKGNAAKALEIFERIWEKDVPIVENYLGETRDIFLKFGTCLMGAKMYDKAIEVFRRIPNPSFTRDFHKMNNLGKRLEKAGRPLEAHRLYVHLFRQFNEKLKSNRIFINRVRKIEKKLDLPLADRLPD